jgi:hypothetical protein
VIDSLTKEIRRRTRHLEKEKADLEGLMDDLVATFSDEDFEAMSQGRRPLSPEAHFVALLHRAVIDLEDVFLTLRVGTHADIVRRRLEGKPVVEVLGLIREARKSTGGRYEKTDCPRSHRTRDGLARR